MNRQSKLFDRAAHCERLMNLSSVNKEIFKQLRDMWIALANECTRMSAKDLAKEINSIEAVQLSLETKSKPTLH